LTGGRTLSGSAEVKVASSGDRIGERIARLVEVSASPLGSRETERSTRREEFSIGSATREGIGTNYISESSLALSGKGSHSSVGSNEGLNRGFKESNVNVAGNGIVDGSTITEGTTSTSSRSISGARSNNGSSRRGRRSTSASRRRSKHRGSRGLVMEVVEFLNNVDGSSSQIHNGLSLSNILRRSTSGNPESHIHSCNSSKGKDSSISSTSNGLSVNSDGLRNSSSSISGEEIKGHLSKVLIGIGSINSSAVALSILLSVFEIGNKVVDHEIGRSRRHKLELLRGEIVSHSSIDASSELALSLLLDFSIEEIDILLGEFIDGNSRRFFILGNSFSSLSSERRERRS